MTRWPRPLFSRWKQGGEDAGNQVDAGAGIADLGAGHHGNAIDLSGRRGRAARALRDVLIDLAVFERTRAESFHRGIDHSRIDLLNLLPRKAHAIDRAGRVVLHHHVAFFDQLREDLLAGFGLRIQRDAALVAVQHREIEAVDARNVAQLAARRIAFARPLDLDDVGAEPRQNLRAGRSRLHMRHIQDPNTLQGFPHDCLSLVEAIGTGREFYPQKERLRT